MWCNSRRDGLSLCTSECYIIDSIIEKYKKGEDLTYGIRSQWQIHMNTARERCLEQYIKSNQNEL